MARDKNARGVALALIGGTGWGFSGACSQFLFARGVDPLWASAVAMICAGAVLVAYMLVTRNGGLRALWSSPKSAAHLALFALAGLTLCRATYLLAIQYSNAGTATVLQYVGPVLIVVATCFAGRRFPSARELIAVVCVVAGTFLLATHGDLGTMALSPEGVFWGLSAAAAVALYSLLPGSLMKSYGSIPVVGSGLLLGGAVLYVATGAWNMTPELDAGGMLAMYGGLTGIGTLLGFAAYLTAINDIGAAKASLLASVETVSATACAALWLHTPFAPMDFAGFALIMATVFLLARFDKKDVSS
ncbi:MAG: DMT family transporter [Slackia sp.]|nr:DMT family transporter [Slackia sp.]